MLEKDNYGLFQQCLHCGYLHDLEAFPVVDEQQTETDEEVAACQRSIEDASNNRPQNTTRLPQYSPKKAVTVDHDLELILSCLHKRHWYNRQ
jgi:hypothetical protein